MISTDRERGRPAIYRNPHSGGMRKNEVLYMVRPGVEAPDANDLAAHEQLKLRELVQMWEEVVGVDVAAGPAGDREDFFEPSLELEAVLRRYGRERVWLRSAGTSSVRNAATGKLRDLSYCEHMPLLGPVESSDRTPPRSEKLANDYMRLETFRDLAGRQCTLTTYNPDAGDSHPDLLETVRHFHARDHRKLVIKTRAMKKGLWKLDLPDDEDLAVAHVDEQLGWTAVHYEARPGAFLVQEHIPMTYEYRVFVINHALVTGAGCIEEFMPMDRSATGAFDAQMRKCRTAMDPVVGEPGIAQLYRDFAREVADRICVESPEMRHYVVDLALDGYGKPVIVEFNGFRNSGFYANDVGLIVDRFCEQEPIRRDHPIPDPLARFLKGTSA